MCIRDRLSVEPKRISAAALVWLGNFDFPGNVRQLENICHWLTVMAPAQVIEPKDLPPEIGVTATASDQVPRPTLLAATARQEDRQQLACRPASAVLAESGASAAL